MKMAQRVIFKNQILWAFFISIIFGLTVEGVESGLSTTPEVQIASASILETPTYKDQWLCRKSSEVRTLRVELKEGCSALYNKSGHVQKIVSSKNKDNCVPVVLKIKGNLETAGWKCKDISDSLITE